MTTRRWGTPGTAIAAIVLSSAFGLALAVLRIVSSEPVERSAEIAGTFAFALVFLSPAILGSLGLRGRPSLVVAAGVLDLVLASLLLSGVGLVLFVPAALFLIAARRMARGDIGAVRSVTTVVVSVALGTTALFALFLRQDPICWAEIPSTGREVRLDPSRFVHGNKISMGGEDVPPGTTESGCSSDSITPTEASASLALVGGMLVLAWSLSRPSTGSEAPTPVAGLEND